MATNKSLIDGIQNSVNTAVNLYTSPANGGGTRITAFTASLDTATETYRVFVGSSAVAAKEIIQAVAIQGPDQNSPLELINHFVTAGDSIFVQVSTGSTIVVRASGIEF